MTLSAFYFPFWWPLCFFLEQNTIYMICLFSWGLYFDWREGRRRRVTEGRGDPSTEEVKAGEVMREMEFAGSVWDRAASWSRKCVFCLHARACHDCIPATFGWLPGAKSAWLRVTIIPGSLAEFCTTDLESGLATSTSSGMLIPYQC